MGWPRRASREKPHRPTLATRAVAARSVPNVSAARDELTVAEPARCASRPGAASRRPCRRRPQPLRVHDRRHGRRARRDRCSLGIRASGRTRSTFGATRGFTRGSVRRTSCRSSRSGRPTSTRPEGRRSTLATSRGRRARAAGLPVRSPWPTIAAGPPSSAGVARMSYSSGSTAGEVTPDFGPPRLHPSCRRGAGRRPDAACRLQRQPANARPRLAQEIASLVRERDGGLARRTRARPRACRRRGWSR